MIILYSKSCVFLWVAYFWCLTTSSANPNTITVFHYWGLCLTIIGRLFTRERIYRFLLIPNTYFLYHFNQSCDYVVPFTDLTQSNTKCSVDSLTLHSHPFNAMSPYICNAICHCLFVPCHIYDECYMENFIKHAYHQCILGNYIKHAYNFLILIHSCQCITQAYINISSNKHVIPYH